MWKVALLVTVLASVAPAQQVSSSRVKVLTVCEVLANVDQYAGTAIAVVGQLERSVSLIDHNEYLSQERCQRPVVAHGHAWSDRIQIWTIWLEGMPNPPVDSPRLDAAIVAAKLSQVRKTTKLGVHQEPRFTTEGQVLKYSHTATVPNEWAVAYGRIVRSSRLDEDCGREGCGGDNVPLILIADEQEVHTLAAGDSPSRK
jgi:hypothetical protein